MIRICYISLIANQTKTRLTYLALASSVQKSQQSTFYFPYKWELLHWISEVEQASILTDFKDGRFSAFSVKVKKSRDQCLAVRFAI